MRPSTFLPTFNRILALGSIVLLSLTILAMGIHEPMNVFDEGYVVYGALRIMNGQVPYRDFFMVYPPGQMGMLALLFKLFGATVLVERVWDLLVRIAISTTVYLLAAKIAGRNTAIVVWLMVTLWLATSGFFGYAVFPVILLVLLNALCLLNFFSQERVRWIFVGGLLVGLAILFRHDLGSYALICTITILTAFVMTHRLQELGLLQRTLAAARVMLAFVAGVFIPVLPVLLYLLLFVPVSELWSDLFMNALTLSNQVSFVPLPEFIPNPLPAPGEDDSRLSFLRYLLMEWIPFYLPFLIIGLAMIAALKNNRLNVSIRWGTMFLALIGLAFSIQALRRADAIHLLPMTIVAVILLAFLMKSLVSSFGRAPLVLAVIILTLITAQSYILNRVSHLADVSSAFPPLECLSNFDRSGCIPVDEDEGHAIRFVQSLVPRGEPIFVGNSHHDRIFMNDIMFYFLSKRESATRYHQLERSLVPTLPVQQEIVESLKTRGVRYVTLVSTWDDIHEPNESGVSSGVTLLDDFIRDNYEQVAEFGDYTIYKRH